MSIWFCKTTEQCAKYWCILSSDYLSKVILSTNFIVIGNGPSRQFTLKVTIGNCWYIVLVLKFLLTFINIFIEVSWNKLHCTLVHSSEMYKILKLNCCSLLLFTFDFFFLLFLEGELSVKRVIWKKSGA